MWDALTTGELAQWFWPPAFQTTVEINAMPGGAYRIASAPVGMTVDATVTAAHAPSNLQLDWAWAGEPDHTTVTIQLTAHEGGTVLTVTHEGNRDEATAANHHDGWQSCLDRLPEYLAGRQQH